MLINVIMAVGIYPVFAILYVILKNNGKPKKNRYYSVTFKKEWLESEETKRQIENVNKQYKKELLIAFLISMIVPSISFVIPYVSVQCTIWCTWIFAAIVIFYVPFVRANGRLRRYKEAQGWAVQMEREVYVELKSLGQVRRVSISQFVAPAVITLLTVISGILYRTSGKALKVNPANEMCFYVLLITFLLCIVLFAVCAVVMDKKSAEVISKDSDVNLNYSRAKKNVWKSFWQQASWLTAAMQVLIAIALWFDKQFMSLLLWGTLGYSVVVIVICLLFANKLAKIDKSYEDKRDIEVSVDDDRYWIGGIFYYNPNDRHSMVETRIGMGTTTNMARPLGWILDAIGIASILLCIGMCTWLVLEEFTPISLSAELATESTHAQEELCIKADHLKAEYEIWVSDITEIACIDELPGMSKINGSAMDNMYKGKFYISEEGRKCQVFLNPQNSMFMRIQTVDTIYYIGGVNDEETQAVYDLVMKHM